MAFTGKENHAISLKDAADLTRNYRTAPASGAKAEFFGKDAIEGILKQEGCVGIRIYYGLDNNGTQKLVLVGTDANEDDIDGGVLAELGQPCPPFCGRSNSLNS